MTIEQKVAALLRKTVTSGATPGEQDAAVAKARELVQKHGLKAADYKWPNKAAKAAPRTPNAATPGKGATKPAKPATKPAKRATRGDEVVELLQRKGGATIAEMVQRFGIQPHSLRAIISVESRKRGLKVELVGKAHYRII